jgi:hypothetical protein
MEFKENVNRYQWAACGFSGDGQNAVGGTYEANQYRLLVWDTGNGQLMAQLEGSAARGKLRALAWHPTRAFIVGCSGNG